MAQKMGITGNPPAPSGRFPWTAAILLVVLFTSGLIVASLSQTLWERPNLVPQSSPSSSGIVAVEPTATPTPEPTPSPSKVLGQGMMGGILVQLGGKKHVSYGLGYWFTPPGNPDYPKYHFPLVLSKAESDGEGWQEIAEISDPNIEKFGGEWVLTVEDPDRAGFILQVKLIRDEELGYRSELTFSPNGGRGWFSPAHYPARVPPGN